MLFYWLVLTLCASAQVEAELARELESTQDGTDAAQAAAGTGQTPFQWLHVSTLREYLEREFARGCDFSCAGGWDLERLIDDFIFVCFFVGNDFLPHLPSLDIRNGAIDTLLDLYKKLFSHMGGSVGDHYLIGMALGSHSQRETSP